MALALLVLAAAGSLPVAGPVRLTTAPARTVPTPRHALTGDAAVAAPCVRWPGRSRGRVEQHLQPARLRLVGRQVGARLVLRGGRRPGREPRVDESTGQAPDLLRSSRQAPQQGAALGVVELWGRRQGERPLRA
ncbi:hypothetical protein N866_06860 [Actinotalea ferrariae CF5-4]|uniref:Secreted protein n=1 Tax=Actinotalea ferrariae CF5-4 TaxID=948458 RepID=A0A021VN41_9CELL|nr:hypothetical protein N866_06860 [Actinotalea ferrariae CF5-4]